jgi:predicted NUDIX family phosphoesterase
LIAEAQRELEEEVGYQTNEHLYFSGLILDRLKIVEDDGTIYVGQVHAGLLTMLEQVI